MPVLCPILYDDGMTNVMNTQSVNTPATPSHCSDIDEAAYGSIEHAVLFNHELVVTAVVEDDNVFVMINGNRVGKVSVDWSWASPSEAHYGECDYWENEESTCPGFTTVEPEVHLTLSRVAIENDSRTYVRTSLW